MTLERFTDIIKTEVEKRVGEGKRVEIRSVMKNNGLKLTGLTIISEGINISPTIYLDNFYEAYENDRITLLRIVKIVVETYENNKPNESMEMKFFLDFNNVKPCIDFKIINTEQNRGLLSTCPHVDYLDWSVVFMCVLSREDAQTASILIKNEHAELWKTNANELFEIAKGNAYNHNGFQAKRMYDVLLEIAENEDFDNLPESVFDEDMVILTNENRVDGAGVILYPGMLERLSDKYGNFVILPSSVHELILVAYKEKVPGEADIRAYSEMVEAINEEQVDLVDRLSNNVYFYNKELKQLNIA